MANQDFYYWIDATGWTLFHSVWQISVIGGLVWLIFRFISKDNARVRYGISVLSLFFTFVSAIFTFSHYIAKADSGTENGYSITPELLLYLFQQGPVYSESWSLNNLNIEKFFPIMVNVWFIGVCLLSMHMTYSYLQSVRLKRHLTFPAGKSTKKILDRLIRKFNLKRKILIKESGYIQSPSLIGYFKPVILLPVSMISGIPGNQLEIIIAHELAHIKRHDYMFQFIQSIIELVFFYHPVVWWLSSVVNTEREHICDDLAVKVCGESITLIKALNNMEAIRKKRFEMVLGLSGKNDNLLNRVQRILRKRTDSGKTNKLVMSGLFMFLITGLILVSNFAISGNTFSGEQFFSKINVVEENTPFHLSNKDFVVDKKKKKKKKKSKKLNPPEVITQEKFEVKEMPKMREKRFELKGFKQLPKDSLKLEWVQKKADEIIGKQTEEMERAYREIEKINLESKKEKKRIELHKTLNKLNFNNQEFQMEMKEHQKDLEERIKELSGEEFQKRIKKQERELQEKLKEVDENRKFSKEEKTKIEKGLQEAVERINSKEYQEDIRRQIEKTRKALREHLKEMKSGELENRLMIKREAIQKELQRIESPEFQKQMQEELEESKKQIREHLMEVRTPEYRRKLEQQLKEHGNHAYPGENIEINRLHNLPGFDEEKPPVFIRNGNRLSQEQVNKINPNEIDCIRVVKGSEAIEKYGEEAKNGVVLIGSKSDKSNIVKLKGPAGKNAPLYVIHGKKISTNKELETDLDNVKSISVLKDENATKVYGQDAKHGVIIINSKNHQSNWKNGIEIKGHSRKNAPLYILEGKRINLKKLKKLNKNSIQSVEVLKDSTAVEKFGKKAANGAIVIDLKK